MRTLLACLLLTALTAACKNPKKSGFFSGPIEPTIAGEWDATLQSSSMTATMQMSLTQTQIAVDGVYTAPALSGARIGDEGTVAGLTTGQGFNITLTATTPGCVAKIDMNGFNAGDDLAFNFSGVDCSSAPVSGQGYGVRPG